jgi:hypothetical protein
MRQSFYRKVVLSASPRPGSYAAMLITDRHIGAPAFATAEDKVWRMARSPAGVEDAIHHDGRFYSITYAGDIEAWERDAGTGEFTSKVVAPRLSCADERLLRKYLAVSPDGKLMAVLKHAKATTPLQDLRLYSHYSVRSQKTILRVFFTLKVLNESDGRWETADVGDNALFVGVNSSLCVPTREHRGIDAGCVYFTNDEVGGACLRNAQASSNHSHSERDEYYELAVYRVKTGRTECLQMMGEGNNPRWPPPAWFTPSFL